MSASDLLAGLIPQQFKLLAAAGAAAALVGALAWYQHHLVEEGRIEANAKHALADAARERAEYEAVKLANSQVASRQAALDAALAALADRERDLHEQQRHNAALQSDLAAGRVRLPVAVTLAGGHPAGQGEGGAAAGLDPQPEAGAELDPQAAGRVVELTGTGDAAIVRLNACIVAYDAAAKAVNP
jgi:hypothetical protein